MNTPSVCSAAAKMVRNSRCCRGPNRVHGSTRDDHVGAIHAVVGEDGWKRGSVRGDHPHPELAGPQPLGKPGVLLDGDHHGVVVCLPGDRCGDRPAASTDLHDDRGAPSLAGSGHHGGQPLGQLGTGGQQSADIAGRPRRRREKSAPAATERALDRVVRMRGRMRGHRAQCTPPGAPPHYRGNNC